MTFRRKNADLRASAIMTVLCIIWGVQQVAIKGVAEEISPVLQVALRSGIAALLVLVVMSCKKESLRQSRPYLMAGCVVGCCLHWSSCLLLRGSAIPLPPIWRFFSTLRLPLPLSVCSFFILMSGSCLHNGEASLSRSLGLRWHSCPGAAAPATQ